MAINSLFRKVYSDDISLGLGSTEIVDNTGATHLVHQFNASFLPVTTSLIDHLNGFSGSEVEEALMFLYDLIIANDGVQNVTEDNVTITDTTKTATGFVGTNQGEFNRWLYSVSSLSGKVKINSTDNSPDFLNTKININEPITKITENNALKLGLAYNNNYFFINDNGELDVSNSAFGKTSILYNPSLDLPQLYSLDTGVLYLGIGFTTPTITNSQFSLINKMASSADLDGINTSILWHFGGTSSTVANAITNGNALNLDKSVYASIINGSQSSYGIIENSLTSTYFSTLSELDLKESTLFGNHIINNRIGSISEVSNSSLSLIDNSRLYDISYSILFGKDVIADTISNSFIYSSGEFNSIENSYIAGINNNFSNVGVDGTTALCKNCTFDTVGGLKLILANDIDINDNPYFANYSAILASKDTTSGDTGYIGVREGSVLKSIAKNKLDLNADNVTQEYWDTDIGILEEKQISIANGISTTFITQPPAVAKQEIRLKLDYNVQHFVDIQLKASDIDNLINDPSIGDEDFYSFDYEVNNGDQQYKGIITLNVKKAIGYVEVVNIKDNSSFLYNFGINSGIYLKWSLTDWYDENSILQADIIDSKNETIPKFSDGILTLKFAYGVISAQNKFRNIVKLSNNFLANYTKIYDNESTENVSLYNKLTETKSVDLDTSVTHNHDDVYNKTRTVPIDNTVPVGTVTKFLKVEITYDDLATMLPNDFDSKWFDFGFNYTIGNDIGGRGFVDFGVLLKNETNGAFIIDITKTNIYGYLLDRLASRQYYIINGVKTYYNDNFSIHNGVFLTQAGDKFVYEIYIVKQVGGYGDKFYFQMFEDNLGKCTFDDNSIITDNYYQIKLGEYDTDLTADERSQLVLGGETNLHTHHDTFLEYTETGTIGTGFKFDTLDYSEHNNDKLGKLAINGIYVKDGTNATNTEELYLQHVTDYNVFLNGKPHIISNDLSTNIITDFGSAELPAKLYVAYFIEVANVLTIKIVHNLSKKELNRIIVEEALICTYYKGTSTFNYTTDFVWYERHGIMDALTHLNLHTTKGAVLNSDNIDGFNVSAKLPLNYANNNDSDFQLTGTVLGGVIVDEDIRLQVIDQTTVTNITNNNGIWQKTNINNEIFPTINNSIAYWDTINKKSVELTTGKFVNVFHAIVNFENDKKLISYAGVANDTLEQAQSQIEDDILEFYIQFPFPNEIVTVSHSIWNKENSYNNAYNVKCVEVNDLRPIMLNKVTIDTGTVSDIWKRTGTTIQPKIWDDDFLIQGGVDFNSKSNIKFKTYNTNENIAIQPSNGWVGIGTGWYDNIGSDYTSVQKSNGLFIKDSYMTYLQYSTERRLYMDGNVARFYNSSSQALKMEPTYTSLTFNNLDKILINSNEVIINDNLTINNGEILLYNTITQSKATNNAILYQKITGEQSDINDSDVAGFKYFDALRDPSSSTPVIAGYAKFINRNSLSAFPTAIRKSVFAIGVADGIDGQSPTVFNALEVDKSKLSVKNKLNVAINTKSSHPTNYRAVYQDMDTLDYYTLT